MVLQGSSSLPGFQRLRGNSRHHPHLNLTFRDLNLIFRAVSDDRSWLCVFSETYGAIDVDRCDIKGKFINHKCILFSREISDLCRRRTGRRSSGGCEPGP